MNLGRSAGIPDGELYEKAKRRDGLMGFAIAMPWVGQGGYDSTWMLSSNLHQTRHTRTFLHAYAYRVRIV